jgi:choline dehydrogenase-like flavoprotein
MKRMMLAASFVACWFAVPAQAQEHFTEGPVWAVSYYRILPDRADDYLKWIRANYLPTAEAEKKQGLILDYKVFFNTSRRDEKDWDIAYASLYPSYAKALDYSAEDEAKGKAIVAKQYKTKDEAKQQEIVAPRLAMRVYIGTNYSREVTLKPLP